MSLKEAYSMAHSAQCRLHMAASEPDRNLRFVVGHLMHYESVRLRIVEIEHDISTSQRGAVSFQGTGHVNQTCDRQVQKKPSTGQLGRKSPPPQRVEYDPEDDDDDDVEDDDPWSGGEDADGEPGDDLGLTRFPSGTARPPQPPPDLLPDDSDEDEDDEPVSPEEPDRETLERAMQGEGSKDFANLYDAVRKCPCHKHQDAPSFENFWELPAAEGGKEGVTRAVAQVWA